MNLLLLITTLLLGQFEPTPPEPNLSCTTDWGIMWIIPECKHCDWIGTYVLWHCYDAENNDHYFEAQCYYEDDEPIDPIPPTAQVYWNYLSIVQTECKTDIDGNCAIIGEPITP